MAERHRWVIAGEIGRKQGLPEDFCQKGSRLAGQQQGHLLHVLTGRREQALRLHLGQATETGVTVAMQLLGIGKAALHRFLAPGVQSFALLAQPMGVDRFLEILPEMPGHQFLMVPALRALHNRHTVPGSRHIPDSPADWSSGTAEPPRPDSGSSPGPHRRDSPACRNSHRGVLVACNPSPRTTLGRECPADLRGEIPGIQPDGAHSQIKAFHDPIQAGKVGLAVMDIARRDVGIDDQGMHGINGTVSR